MRCVSWESCAHVCVCQCVYDIIVYKTNKFALETLGLYIYGTGRLVRCRHRRCQRYAAQVSDTKAPQVSVPCMHSAIMLQHIEHIHMKHHTRVESVVPH